MLGNHQVKVSSFLPLLFRKQHKQGTEKEDRKHSSNNKPLSINKVISLALLLLCLRLIRGMEVKEHA